MRIFRWWWKWAGLRTPLGPFIGGFLFGLTVISSVLIFMYLVFTILEYYG